MLWENIMGNIWIDLDNSPHVPLFRPIIEALEARGHSVTITARDYGQTLPLLDMWGMKYQAIGRHGGKGKAGKIINLFHRANQLRSYIRNRKIDLALSHGSRTQLIAARMSGIKSILMLDYEFTEAFIFNKAANYILMPSMIPGQRLTDAGFNMNKVRTYPYFKEEIYLSSFTPDTGLRKSLSIPDNAILIMLRPSAMLGNYHNELSEKIITAFLRKVKDRDDIYILAVPRTKEDRALLSAENCENLHFLEKPVNGLQLIFNSDIVISGGGTMNRESALLGVPTYSVFTGKRPYLDEFLAEKGRLSFINSPEDIDKINILKRSIGREYNYEHSNPSAEISGIIERIMNEK